MESTFQILLILLAVLAGTALLARRVIDATGDADVAADAPDQDETAAGFLELVEGRVDRRDSRPGNRLRASYCRRA